MTETRRREPLFNIPRILLVVVLGMAAVHGLRFWLADPADVDVLARFAFVPGRATFAVDPAAVLGRLAAAAAGDPDVADVGRFFLGTGTLQPWTVLTYAALHGSWTHVGLNALWLLAFGAPVARRIGPPRFLLLLAGGAVAGAAAHFAVDPLSLQPLIGASAAVSACMGAALRFVFQTRPSTTTGPADHAPLQSLGAVLRDRRAVTFLGVWLVSNAVTGIGAVPLGLSDMPIAWQAHVGGLAFGLLAFPLFDRGRAPPARPDPGSEEPSPAD